MVDTQSLMPSPGAALMPGNVECSRCNGSGRIVLRTMQDGSRKPNMTIDLICCRCGGHGSHKPWGAE